MLSQCEDVAGQAWACVRYSRFIMNLILSDDSRFILMALCLDISKSPSSMFAHLLISRVQELKEGRDSTSSNHSLGLLTGTTSDICESPGIFKLQGWLVYD